jgi:hypothetical protein
LERVPSCGRRGEAHRGRGHGGAPTLTGKRARDGGGQRRRRSGVRTAWGRLKRGSAGAQRREGEGERGSEAQVAEGRAVASFTRDVGAETSVRAARAGGYAGTRELTEGAREQRERGSGRTGGESGHADGRASQDRERKGGGGEGARAREGSVGPKGRGEQGVWATFPFFFYFSNCFPFSFYLLHLIQFQICYKFKLAPSSICIKQKVKFRVQHDATFHTPLEFSLLDYNYT